ncbi:hypothetical protein WJX72_004142 [[Myrmecia] bisecta]|uniref:Uncharacterized protein n=1 Tax=[Myrmecia] bisecta TaxID=41462 RepID=A0AAW1QQ08_9CHLO
MASKRTQPDLTEAWRLVAATDPTGCLAAKLSTANRELYHLLHLEALRMRRRSRPPVRFTPLDTCNWLQDPAVVSPTPPPRPVLIVDARPGDEDGDDENGPPPHSWGLMNPVTRHAVLYFVDPDLIRASASFVNGHYALATLRAADGVDADGVWTDLRNVDRYAQYEYDQAIHGQPLGVAPVFHWLLEDAAAALGVEMWVPPALSGDDVEVYRDKAHIQEYTYVLSGWHAHMAFPGRAGPDVTLRKAMYMLRTNLGEADLTRATYVSWIEFLPLVCWSLLERDYQDLPEEQVMFALAVMPPPGNRVAAD